MEISRNEDGAFVLSQIEGHLGEFLRAIVASADPHDHAAALRRLFPIPVTDPEQAQARAEWNEYVRPELAALFNEAALVVSRDLEGMEERLVIPPSHVDAWLNTLNQARLVLAARFDIGDEEMERPITPVLENEREIALFQIHLYGVLQECLVRGE